MSALRAGPNQLRQCPTCNSQEPASALFCGICGNTLPRRQQEPPQLELDYGAAGDDDILVIPLHAAEQARFLLLTSEEWDFPQNPSEDSDDWERIPGARVIWAGGSDPRPVAVVASVHAGDADLLEEVRRAASQTPAHRSVSTSFLRRAWKRRPLVVVALVALSLIVGAIASILVLSGRAEGAYLEELRAAKLGGQFNSDAEALARGRRVCRDLENGGKAEGMPADLIAVTNLCTKFAQGFHVLEEVSVDGSFSLIDTDMLTCTYFCYPSISNDGGTCTGTGGYSDIGSGTEVVVTNGDGTQLATTALESGSGSSALCTFKFSFDVIEGEDSYNVSVSHRGTQHFTFSSLKTSGVELSLGD